jgi:uncharacterized tellurite resistance protein B-like protein
MGHDEEEGALLALEVLGEDGLRELRSFFSKQDTETVQRERRAAIAACIWMAKADLTLAPEEDELLCKIIAQSDLPFAGQRELLAAVAQPWPPDRIAKELTQSGMRQLVLALCWQVARADDRVEESESEAYDSLARAFGIDDARAEEIRDLAKSPKGA